MLNYKNFGTEALRPREFLIGRRLLFYVDCALRRFYNRIVSRKSEEIDQSQSNVKKIVDYDWLISCGLRLTTLL